MKNKTWSIVVHGGAGTLKPENYSAAELEEHQKFLKLALSAGAEILKFGGSAVDAVAAAVCVLENCELFNAGRGSVFANHGKIEMDASIMNGVDLNSGAVTGVERIKNPILAAKAVLEKSVHRLFAGEGAQVFARAQGIPEVMPSYFQTTKRWKQYLRDHHQHMATLDHSADPENKHGTVGAVALDNNGHLAAATSTGGLSNKAQGRVSDSAIIGAGTYADDRSIALSATGTGDVFIKLNLAYDVHALIHYQKKSPTEALTYALNKLVEHKGSGGFIGIDSHGEVHMPFTTTGMFRGYLKSSGETEVKVFS